jgi:basic amino acid/polyamine antiporter, APA family
LRCSLLLATAVSYAELSKLYPGRGSSYFYAEQAFLSKTKAFKFARVAKFFTGWASHLYYWVYPGCMVGVTAILVGYLLNQFWPDTFSGQLQQPAVHVPVLHRVRARRRLHRLPRRQRQHGGQHGDQHHPDHRAGGLLRHRDRLPDEAPEGSTVGYHLSNGVAVNYQVFQDTVKDDKGNPLPVLDANNKPTKDANGKPVYRCMADQTDKDGNPVPATDGKAVTWTRRPLPSRRATRTDAYTTDRPEGDDLQLPPDRQVGHRAAQASTSSSSRPASRS